MSAFLDFLNGGNVASVPGNAGASFDGGNITVTQLRQILQDVNSSLAINVKWFGAKGDGRTDDTAAIQQAINTADDGALIIFPYGRYKITSALTITKHLRLWGVSGKQQDGIGYQFATLSQASAVPVVTIDPTFSASVSISNLSLRGGTIGLNIPGTAGGGTDRHSLFENIIISGFSDKGLYLGGTSTSIGARFRKLAIDGGSIGAYGIYSDGTFNLNATSFDDCRVNATTIWGIWIRHGSTTQEMLSISMSNLIVEHNEGGGLNLFNIQLLLENPHVEVNGNTTGDADFSLEAGTGGTRCRLHIIGGHSDSAAAAQANRRVKFLSTNCYLKTDGYSWKSTDTIDVNSQTNSRVIIDVDSTGVLPSAVNNQTSGFLTKRNNGLEIGTVSPTQITANQNDYNPGLGRIFLVTTDASRIITGLANGSDGLEYTYINIGSFNLQFANQSGSSTAANRIITATAGIFTLLPDCSVTFKYDATTSRWRIISSTNNIELATGADLGDTSPTLTATTWFQTARFNTVLGGTRTVTLTTSNMSAGMQWYIERAAAATGAFRLNVGSGPLAVLMPGQWCVVEYDGAAWVCISMGDLPDATGLLTRTMGTANTATWVDSQISELLTLSTVAAFTDTAANLLPANSEILAVVARVQTTITTATDWKLGDPTTAGRFSNANATMTAGATVNDQLHRRGGVATDATGPWQIAAAKVRVTTTGIPGAGIVRITVFYRQFTAPTS